MAEGIHEGPTYFDIFYQCKACVNYVTCPIMPGSKEMEKIIKNGNCPKHKFSSTTRFRRGFR